MPNLAKKSLSTALFFKNKVHYNYLIKKFIPEWLAQPENAKLKLNILIPECTTGAEAYTLAILIDYHFKSQLGERFQITALENNSEDLSFAKNAVFQRESLNQIPLEYQKSSILFGTDELSKWGKIKDHIRSKIDFQKFELNSQTQFKNLGNFDIVFCCNTKSGIKKEIKDHVIQNLFEVVNTKGVLLLDPEEMVNINPNQWKNKGPACFEKQEKQEKNENPEKQGKPNNRVIPVGKKKVLLVDDSKTMTQFLRKVFSSDPELEVVAEINDPREVEMALSKYKPDVMTLDIHMPYLDGCAVLEKVMNTFKIPTVMISSISMEEGYSVLKALELGAVDYLQKPSFSELNTVAPIMIEKIKQAAVAKIQIGNHTKSPVGASQKTNVTSISKNKNGTAQNSKHVCPSLIAIGSSTGGTEALRNVLTGLTENIPPIVIVQHIPPIFSKAFADRMNSLCPFEVKEAEDGDTVTDGRVLVAPGGKQMELALTRSGLQVRVTDAPPVNRHKPSVDVLFNSVADLVGKKAMGVILTGMGADGAKGLLKMRNTGSFTVAQDEESCVVFGMPREAIALGAAEQISPLDEISDVINQQLQLKSKG